MRKNAYLQAGDVVVGVSHRKIYAQIYLQDPADLKSAGNRGVVQSRLQMLHIHVLLVAPLGARQHGVCLCYKVIML